MLRFVSENVSDYSVAIIDSKVLQNPKYMKGPKRYRSRMILKLPQPVIPKVSKGHTKRKPYISMPKLPGQKRRR